MQLWFCSCVRERADALVVSQPWPHGPPQGNRLSELDGRVVAGWASLQELDVSENDLQVGRRGGRLVIRLMRLVVRLIRRSRRRTRRARPAAASSRALPARCKVRPPLLDTPHPAPIAPPQALPPELGLLTRLRTLRARRNRLAALPPALAGCSSLVELHAGFNAVRALPEALGTLRALAVLELRNNHITVRS